MLITGVEQKKKILSDSGVTFKNVELEVPSLRFSGKKKKKVCKLIKNTETIY